MNTVKEWISYYKTNDEKYWDAVNNVMDLARRNPEALWVFIKETVNSPECDDMIMANLAAGPLEDLLNKNGSEYIDRVTEEASRSEKFNTLLGGVWKSGIESEVWSKIESTRKKIW